jgi:glycosyltransferase involved in cell wall biosynthesis
MSNKSLKVSVIISTYNEPEWLRKVLSGYTVQLYKDFELVIADDGSGPETKKVVDRFIDEGQLLVNHVWHPDEGYDKCGILNKAIVASTGEYLVFTDGDCIPRNDFISTHVNHAEKGYFLSGGSVRLPMELSKKITEDDITSQRIFDRSWMLKNGLPGSFKTTKLIQNKTFTSFMDAVTPTKASWNGLNSSGWKADVLAVNGFNEDMHYGGQDREFGERLVNNGLKSKQIRYSAISVHLDHHRPYKTQESINKNVAIRKEVKRSGKTWIENGIEKTKHE